ncbi:hypothetical protein J4Q44_G00336790 [Coregonus suidteri]|uniref:Protein kinase domain-containing protein n=1 Tax=Coregonus suidteri TaxID=861788 RepID=A0AAN8KW58_9TELE
MAFSPIWEYPLLMDFATLAAEPQSLRTSSTQETALRSLSWSGLSLASSVFLPEFPHCKFPVQDDFQILGFIAKGSFGPILKVKDRSKEKTFAVKVLPKSEILKHGVLEQSKEERQVSHPFFHNLQDCLQTQRHLFIMCEYCSTGDLYTYWILEGQFGEDEARVFAAELGCALGFLHDFGIMHRDVKMENVLLSDQGHLHLADFGLSRHLERGARAFIICGTIQYMAPEVLSGGPYSHAADWWSLGILLFSLVTGKFPVPDHCNMLRKLLQKRPVQLILQLKNLPDRPVKATRGLSMDYFQNFDCDILHSPTSPTDMSPTLANINLSQALATVQGSSK